LLKLEEERLKYKEIFDVHQSLTKHRFDKNYAGTKSFNVGDLVLKWDNGHEEKGKHTMFQYLRLAPLPSKKNSVIMISR